MSSFGSSSMARVAGLWLVASVLSRAELYTGLGYK